MTISVHPMLGYQNLVDRAASTLSSSDVAATSAITNVRRPNLAAVANFGTGAGPKSFRLDAGADVEAFDKGLALIRFRGTGWSDLTSIRLRVSPNSDLSSPIYDSDVAGTSDPQFPDLWPNDMPRRPIHVVAFEPSAGTPRYWGIDATRTTGAADLEIARVYMGAGLQLDGRNGVAATVVETGMGVEVIEQEQVSDDDNDFEFIRRQRRTHVLRLKAMSRTHVRGEWYPRFLYACASRDVLFFEKPTETDPATIQALTVWGRAKAEKPVSNADGLNWSQDIIIRERL